MTKDKYKYIEGLLRNYKKNKSRIKILELGLVTDDDYTLGAIDYSKDKIQTSNKSDLSDAVVKREKELEKLKYEVKLTDALLESLNNKDRYIIRGFDICEQLYLNVFDALLGCEKEITLPDGSKTTITIPECTPDDKYIKLRGKGIKKDNGYRGDYYVFIKLNMPTKLTNVQREILKKLKQ